MSDDLGDFKKKEWFKQRVRQEDRKEDNERRRDEQKAKKRDREVDDGKRHQLALEREQLRANISRQEYNRRNNIKREEKAEDQQLKSNIERANHTDSLEHAGKLSEQEHSQQLKRDAQQRQHEVNIRQGELRAEQVFIQDRLEGEKKIQESRNLADYKRAEMLAEFDYQQALSTQQEITTRDISIAREQTERELALAKENNNQLLVQENLKHLSLLEQKARDLFDYEARVKADTNALRTKEDEVLERRLTESRHNFGQDVQKLHAEFLRMQLEEKLKEKLFTHEQETLLRMRKLAFDLGLDTEGLSDKEISEMVAEFQESLP